MMSMLDGFFRYNECQVDELDQFRTMFIAPWGKYTYNGMPFELINAGVTFQCGRNLDFEGLKYRIIVIYIDDLTLFSKK